MRASSTRTRPDRSAPADERGRFEHLFRTHWSAVHAYARRRSADDASAHDVAAEVFTVAWRRRDDIPEAHVLPWLYRTAANVLANRDRSSRRRLRLVERVTAQPAGPGGDIADEVIEDAALRTAFAQLSTEQRETLRLAAWEGLRGEALAAALGVSTNAAALRLSRARARFSELLATADAAAGHEGDDHTGRHP